MTTVEAPTEGNYVLITRQFEGFKLAYVLAESRVRDIEIDILYGRAEIPTKDAALLTVFTAATQKFRDDFPVDREGLPSVISGAKHSFWQLVLDPNKAGLTDAADRQIESLFSFGNMAMKPFIAATLSGDKDLQNIFNGASMACAALVYARKRGLVNPDVSYPAAVLFPQNT